MIDTNKNMLKYEAVTRDEKIAALRAAEIDAVYEQYCQYEQARREEILKKRRIKKKDQVITKVCRILTLLLFTGSVIAYLINPAYSQYEVVKYEIVQVKPDETLEEIAERYKPEKYSMNRYLSDIEQVNSGLDRDKIVSGEFLKIPVYE